MASDVIPRVSAISAAVTRVLGCNPGPFTLQGTNTYLVGRGRRRVLIDTGQGVPEYETVLAEHVASNDVDVSDVLLTHWHKDHVLGVDFVRRLFPRAALWKFPDDHDAEHAWASDIRPIADMATFDVDGGVLTAWHTPGHTADHCMFHFADGAGGALFTGDTILGAGSSVFEDLHSYMTTLGLVRDRLAGSTWQVGELYPAHGPVVRDPRAKVAEYIKHRLDREDQIVAVTRDLGTSGPVDAAAIVAVLYKEVNPAVWPRAERGVVQHLNRLAATGRMEAVGDRWQVRDP
ncbi:beta-lactamase-like protein [Dipodascopsis tothii]|uniref:beta-lactamase-like protein n=1 Tax=Dipodascopsis tothii TaxID=44089 RepID=UPI0034D00AE9